MHIRLFGSFQLTGIEIPLVHTKAQALFAYLLLFPDQSHSREKLADMLWPEATAEVGRRGLSNALYRLRQSLGECIQVEEGTVRLSPPAGWQVDVWAFDLLAHAADTPALQSVVELYTGDLAPEIYDDWIIIPRLERRESYLAALETLAERLTAQHHLNAALGYARRLVWAEPLREHNQQLYLRLLGRLGRRAEALAHYKELCALLRAELDIDPLPETQAIAVALRREAVPPLANDESLPFTGRTAERAALIQQLERLLGGQGGVMAVEGQPGLGKSRLLRELAASARWRNITVLLAPAGNRPVGSPLEPLLAAFTGALTGSRRAQLELALSAETLAACAPLVPAWKDRANLPELPPVHQRYRFEQAFAAMMGELTRLTPLLFLLDDWHWADPLAWEYLEALVQLAPGLRLLVVLSWRRAEMEERAEWRTIQSWEAEGRLAVLTLLPWTLSEMAAALPAAYQTATPRLWSVSSGNPFLLTEALHALSEGRSPETDVAARAQSLPTEVRTVLECATVWGRTLPLALWVAATGLEPDALAPLADTLVQRYFLQVVENGYAFTHDLVQAALYQAIPVGGQRHWHGRCAQALEALTPDQYRARAFHLDHAGQNEAAADLYRQTSTHDLSLGAYVEARTALNRALELWPEPPSQSQAERVRAEMLLESARLHLITDESEAQAVVEEAMRVAKGTGDKVLQARAAGAAGEMAVKIGRNEDGRAYLNLALSLARASGNGALQLEILDQLGTLAWNIGQLAEASDWYNQQLALARELADRAGEAAALLGLGLILVNSDEQAAGEAHLRESLAIRRTLGDHFKVAQALLNLFSAVQASGKLDEALTLGEQALAASEHVGYARGVAIVYGALALVQCALGHFAEARRSAMAALDYFVRVNDLIAVGLYTDTLGLVFERGGETAEGEALISTAVEQLLANESEFFAALAQMDLGALRVRAGRQAEALPVLEQARPVFEANNAAMELQHTTTLIGLAWARLGQREQAEQIAAQSWEIFQTTPPEGEERQYYLWTLWQLLLNVGRTADADAVLRAAYATLQAQASRLSDPVLRQSFFEKVPVNREIVAAHAELAQTAAQITVRVVGSTVPLGRALTGDDYVEVRWTVLAPEDEAITDPAVRRRFVLKRLLDEAAVQGAAPTDDDLARALGVSRRTILRDMEALEQAGSKRSTRKRKQ